MLNGAAPQYSTVAASPPISAAQLATGFGRMSMASRPSTPGGVVAPSPVPTNTTTEPGRAGALVEFGVKPSSLWMAAWPEPCAFTVNNPGAVAATPVGNGSLLTP